MGDSADHRFWDERYAAGDTPWQLDRPPRDLVAWAAGVAAGTRVLIPGCGAGHEVAFLAGRGLAVDAIDFSAPAVATAQAHLGPRAGLVRQADFFALVAEPYDVVYEHTFLCALPPRLRPAYAAQAARLVRRGGLLVGCFVVGPTASGPPYSTPAEELDVLLGGAFELLEDAPTVDPPPFFVGLERWQVRRRHQSSTSD